MIHDLKVPLIDMILALSNAIDLVNHAIVDHHKRVAYIAARIAGGYGLSRETQNEIILAGALHDIGAISLEERLDILNYEVAASHRHGELGYRILNSFPPFSGLARFVRFHHTAWEKGVGNYVLGEEVPLESHILHLADRIEVLIDREEEVLLQVSQIENHIRADTGRLFRPDLVEVFLSLSKKEAFWLDTVCSDMTSLLRRNSLPVTVPLNMDDLTELARFFARVIDLRSRFTATHSSGVATVAAELARLSGFSGEECRMMRIAGYFHDLGKLSLSKELLEKPGALDESERSIVRKHTFYTYRVLENIRGLEVINSWASLHHERLDGTGYPFRLGAEEISSGSRIMAVADIFTAISEDRPYRAGMGRSEAMLVLRTMARSGAIDMRIVDLLEENYGDINDARMDAQAHALEEYRFLLSFVP